MSDLGKQRCEGREKLTENMKENVVIDQSRGRANALCMEDVKGGIPNLAINTPSRCETEVVAGINGKLVIIKQFDDQSGPLIRGNGNGTICLSHVTDRRLRSRGEVINSETYGGKGAPGAWERICINGGINRGSSGCRITQVRKIMYGMILARLSWFRPTRVGRTGKGQ